MTSHTGKKPFPCNNEDCTQSFMTSTKLRKHLRVHSSSVFHLLLFIRFYSNVLNPLTGDTPIYVSFHYQLNPVILAVIRAADPNLHNGRSCSSTCARRIRSCACCAGRNSSRKMDCRGTPRPIWRGKSFRAIMKSVSRLLLV